MISPWYPTLQLVALGPLVLWLMLHQVYSPDALRVKLESVQMVDRTLEEVEADVRAAFCAEGIVLCIVKSSRAHDGVSKRYDMKKLTCRRGGTNRQASYQNSLLMEDGKVVMHGARTGFWREQRTGCVCERTWLSTINTRTTVYSDGGM